MVKYPWKNQVKQSALKNKTALAFEFDKQFYNDTIKIIAGADEVGRGPLAGPVVVAAVIMDNGTLIEGIRDSKAISEKKRNSLYYAISDIALSIGIGWIEPEEIDSINILNATRKAFKISLERLELKPDLVLLDYINGVDTDLHYKAFKKGDDTSYVIGCASIIAKVTRDRYMIEMDGKYPNYGFARNKGYGTKEHMEAIRKYGPCPLHRKTFIKKILEEIK